MQRKKTGKLTCHPNDNGKKFTHYQKLPVVVLAVRMDRAFWVETLEGTMHGRAGDYLIKGVKGELYPCKPEIFEETYRVLETNEDKQYKEAIL